MEDLLTSNRENNSINGSYWIMFIFNRLAQEHLTSVQVNLKGLTSIIKFASLPALFNYLN